MKLLSVLVISIRGQDYDSLAGALGAISLEDFALPDAFVAGTDLEEAINEALDALVVEAAENEVEAEERYFGISSVTTTTTTPGTTTTTKSPGSGCFKCDAMSMTACAVSGVFETCEGESSSCFIEVREINQQLTQLCTGCKNTQACYNLQQNNFLGTYQHHQCKPHYAQQQVGRRRTNEQSVCRQCFDQCTLTDGKCFSAHDTNFEQPNVNNLTPSGGTPGNKWIQYDFAAQKTDLVAQSKFSNPISAYTGTEANPIGLGIPTGAVHDQTSSLNMRMSILDPIQWNLYFASSNASPNDGIQRGKDHPKALAFTAANTDYESVAVSPTTTGRDQRHMVYWGVLGASKSWWESDLKQIQAEIRSGGAAKVMQ